MIGGKVVHHQPPNVSRNVNLSDSAGIQIRRLCSLVAEVVPDQRMSCARHRHTAMGIDSCCSPTRLHIAVDLGHRSRPSRATYFGAIAAVSCRERGERVLMEPSFSVPIRSRRLRAFGEALQPGGSASGFRIDGRWIRSTIAAVSHWHIAEHAFDMGSATRPGWTFAGLAGHSSTHMADLR